MEIWRQLLALVVTICLFHCLYSETWIIFVDMSVIELIQNTSFDTNSEIHMPLHPKCRATVPGSWSLKPTKQPSNQATRNPT